MALKNNGYRDTFGCVRYFGGTVVNAAVSSAAFSNYNQTGPMRNFTAGEGCTNTRAGIANGYLEGGSWSFPMKAGSLSTYNNVTGTGSVTGPILAVKLAEASISGSGDITAFGGLVVQLIAAITGTGAISNADLKAFLQMTADITGSGDITANLTAIADLIADILGSGDITSLLTGTGAMSADLVVTGTGLTTSNVGQAVWAAIASANNTSGTMGEKLNDAGSASNPWTEVIESGFTAAEILRLLAAVAAGDGQALNGLTTTFKSLDGTKDRVTATLENNNRTITGLDVSS